MQQVKFDKYKRGKTSFVNGRRDDFKAFRTERKGERLCPEDGIDASGIYKIHDTSAFEGI